MKSTKLILFIFIIGLIILLVGLFLFYKKNNNDLNNQKNNLNLDNKSTVIVGDIVINSPKQNEKILSPLKISGQARGYWFFEAQFTVELYDENNNLLGQTILTAQDEWMTENFVPFQGELNFSQSNTKKGFLRFLSANPSGEIENQKIFDLPIEFN